MSDPVEILDMSAIVCDYLREQPAIQALAGERVATRSPEDFGDPWVKVTLIDPQNVTGNSRVEWLLSYYLQFDCYAGAANRYHEEAFDLSRAVRVGLTSMLAADLDDAVVTDVAFASMPSQPDTDLDPARERVILDAELIAHPKA